jgi:hypothetical protein
MAMLTVQSETVVAITAMKIQSKEKREKKKQLKHSRKESFCCMFFSFFHFPNSPIAQHCLHLLTETKIEVCKLVREIKMMEFGQMKIIVI